MEAQSNSHDGSDMPGEIDFSGAVRGKFFQSGMTVKVPVYLDTEVQAYLSARANVRGVDVGQLVNELLGQSS